MSSKSLSCVNTHILKGVIILLCVFVCVSACTHVCGWICVCVCVRACVQACTRHYSYSWVVSLDIRVPAHVIGNI
jgi:hypothetical protein